MSHLCVLWRAAHHGLDDALLIGSVVGLPATVCGYLFCDASFVTNIALLLGVGFLNLGGFCFV